MKRNASYNHFGLSIWSGALARWRILVCPASTQRGGGSQRSKWFVRPARSVVEYIVVCNRWHQACQIVSYVHAMNILSSYMPIVIQELRFFFLKIMLTDSNLVVTNIYSSVQWYLLQNLIQPSRKNSSILHFCCMRLSDLVSKFKIAANQCCVIVTYILSFNKEHLARFSLRPRQ